MSWRKIITLCLFFQNYLKNKNPDKLLKIRMLEEQARRDGIPGIRPKEFQFFTEIVNNSRVKSAYDTMQRQYVLSDEDRIEYGIAIETLAEI